MVQMAPVTISLVVNERTPELPTVETSGMAKT
jgi:hypothetical protein